jgi:hypothetical protein
MILIRRLCELASGTMHKPLPKKQSATLPVWLDDVALDTEQRAYRIAALEADSTKHTTMENEAIERGLAMFASYERNSRRATQLKYSATIARSECKSDELSGNMQGLSEAVIAAIPLQIVAYLLNCDSRHLMSTTDGATTKRVEVLELVNAHHTVIFQLKNFPLLSRRSFLNSVIAKRVSKRPLT